MIAIFQQIFRLLLMLLGKTGKAFWLYVRVDTFVEPAYAALFDGIKGGIVYYFSVPGYVDSINRLASIGLLIALVLLIIVLGTILLRPIRLPPSRQRSRTVDPFRKADEADDFSTPCQRNAPVGRWINLHDGNDN